MAVLAGGILLGARQAPAAPISLHAENPHYFDFRGKPTVLVGSTEHYGAVVNADFDYIRYLDEVRACGLNFVRIFSGAYVETTGSFGIASNTLAPAPGKLIVPWAKTNAGQGDRYDLSQWNAAYFHRLRGFVKAAGNRGIVVELTLFSPYYNEALWQISPFHPSNQIQGVGAGGRDSCFQANSDLLPYQKALARKCLEELRGFDNFYLEPINEPYEGVVSDEWQALIIAEWEAEQGALPADQRVLIAQNIAKESAVLNSVNASVSIINFHYALPAAALTNQGLNRVIGDDETGFAGQVDFPYRREGWEFMLAGGGVFNHLDYSFTADREDGLASSAAPGGGGPSIRRQLGILRWFLEELPLLRCSPQTAFVTGGVPSGGSVQVLGEAGKAYGLYLRGGVSATLTVDLPAGTWRGRWINTKSGVVAGRVDEWMHGGGAATLQSPAYLEDIALLLFSGDSPPPEVVLTQPLYQAVATSNESLGLAAEASVTNGAINRVEFLKDDVLIGSDDTPPYSFSAPAGAQGNHVFRARVVVADGRTSVSPPVKVALMGPYQSGVNLNGPALVSNGQSWFSESGALTAGMEITNAQPSSSSEGLQFYPHPDVVTRSLVSSQVLRLNNTQNPQLSIRYPVPDGDYDVFFSLVEGEAAYSRDVNVSIEGVPVAQGIGDLALGEWVNYGPYRTSVVDGMLDLAFVRESKGSPKISNFSIYQAELLSPVVEAFLSIGTSPGVAVLSWPKQFGPTVETSIALDQTADWQDSVFPSEDFGLFHQMVVPTTESQRFFRLLKD